MESRCWLHECRVMGNGVSSRAARACAATRRASCDMLVATVIGLPRWWHVVTMRREAWGAGALSNCVTSNVAPIWVNALRSRECGPV